MTNIYNNIRNMGKSMKLAGLSAIVAGSMVFSGCEGGSGGSDSQDVYRVNDGSRSYTETNAPIDTLNLLQGDGINDAVGYRDFNTAQEAQAYINSLGNGSSSSSGSGSSGSGSSGSGSSSSSGSGSSGSGSSGGSTPGNDTGGL